MYSTPRLDTPPPSSRFQRPWSPDPYDPLPSVSQYDNDDYLVSSHCPRQREPSDVSVEALDLADYAATLGRNNNRNLYNQQPAFRPYDPYPPSPPPLRPLASPESVRTPSLASHSVASSQSFSPRTRPPNRRPFSLPTPSLPRRSLQSHPSHYGHPRIADQDAEIDLAHFPSFSRAWYEPDNPHRGFSLPSSAYGGDVQHKLSPFDPAFPTDTYDLKPYSPYASSPPPSYPHLEINSRSSRDVVPWMAGEDADAPVNPALKEERLRMLEQEFGGKQMSKPEDEEHAVGSVDSKGKLITDGPKRRIAVRCIELLLALTAAIASIYAALIIKPPTTPPPQGTLAAYILYVLSVLQVLAITYIFFIYPCCCGGRRKVKDSPYNAGPAGMMVLPVQSMPGGKKKGGKKGKGGGGEGVQVNLIVDPSMFGGGERERVGDWEGEGDDGSQAPLGSATSASGRTRRAPKRRGIFAGLAMEAEWQRARKLLKWTSAFDVVAMVLWGAEFVIILMGKRCPSGSCDGWCDAYNLATAAACLSCVAFMCSLYFDIKDLHASKSSPRTRPL